MTIGNQSLNWDDLRWLSEITTVPLLLKGVCHPDDARRAIDLGVDGIMTDRPAVLRDVLRSRGAWF